MTPLPLTPEFQALARRIIWFDEPDVALADPVRFMAYAFAYATHQDMAALRRVLSDADLLEALDHAPPGIIDPRSWSFWNAKLGRSPAPPLPRRRLP